MNIKKPNKKIDNIFVVGTGTGVGKTVLSLLLMQFFYEKGYKPFYLKPLQTGCKDPCDIDSDARFIYKHVANLSQKDPADSVIYCFKAPKAPYFAARNEQKTIDIAVIQKAVNQKSLAHNPVIIEAAGGLFVPVTKKMLVLDLIGMINAKPVIAAQAGLGTINHTLLSIEALQNRGIQPKGVVFINAPSPPVSEEMIEENIEAVEKFSSVKVYGVVGQISDFSNPDFFSKPSNLRAGNHTSNIIPGPHPFDPLLSHCP